MIRQNLKNWYHKNMKNRDRGANNDGLDLTEQNIVIASNNSCMEFFSTWYIFPRFIPELTPEEQDIYKEKLLGFNYCSLKQEDLRGFTNEYHVGHEDVIFVDDFGVFLDFDMYGLKFEADLSKHDEEIARDVQDYYESLGFKVHGNLYELTDFFIDETDKTDLIIGTMDRLKIKPLDHYLKLGYKEFSTKSISIGTKRIDFSLKNNKLTYQIHKD